MRWAWAAGAAARMRCHAIAELGGRDQSASWPTALERSPLTRFPAAAPAPPTGASTIRLSDVPTGAPGDRVTSGGDTQSWMGIRKQRGRAQHMNSESPIDFELRPLMSAQRVLDGEIMQSEALLHRAQQPPIRVVQADPDEAAVRDVHFMIEIDVGDAAPDPRLRP
jgi:hypothetical protein